MHTNALIHESSPYLLQHARNPVDWLPWGDAAFERARREDKPIFLSVGYSTCHWCHVMERESFENDEIAAVLNEHFVPVKVDREERPDVDRVYMTFVQAATGSGGWPMSVWLTPELKPFFGGTYFPPEDRWGRPGFKSVLLRIAAAWARDRAAIAASSETVLTHLRDAISAVSAPAGAPDPALLARAFEEIRGSYDPQEGGFGGAPKFPQPSVPDFLLRYHARTGDAAARDMALATLRKMAMGGICDHIGGGFHRYSVDARWHVPHFEKMLYDQAQLACAYVDAYQLTRDGLFGEVARDILDYVRRDMTGETGQFYSAEDADSARPEHPQEHAEGACYVWTLAEMEAVLDADAASVFAFVYGVERDGNVRDDPHGEFRGRNVLAFSRSVPETAARFGRSEAEIAALLDAARRRLFDARAARPRPHLDDKTITAWNGLMISAFARGAQVLEDEGYLATARRAADFSRARLYDERGGTLLRRYRDGAAAIPGYADDYAFLIRGLIDLYEACFDPSYLEWALALQSRQDAIFWDETAGGYFSTSGADGSILLRMKEEHDGAEPSPNSVAATNLLRLAHVTGDRALRERAASTFAAFAHVLGRVPSAMPQMLAALDMHLHGAPQIVIAGEAGAPDTRALLRAVHERFIPNRILLLADGAGAQAALARLAPPLRDMTPIGGKATAYVCDEYVCKLPVTDPAALRGLLDAR